MELTDIAKALPEAALPKAAAVRARRGEIHAVLAQEPLVSVLAGMLSGRCPVKGTEVLLAGSPVFLASPRKALRLGVGAVCRRDGLADNFSLLDQLRLTGGLPRSKKQAREQAEVLAGKYGLRCGDMDCPAGDLPSGERFRGELLRALLQGASVLVLEQPDERLSLLEMEETRGVLRRLADDGKTVLILSRRRDGFAWADEQTLLFPQNSPVPQPLPRKDIAVGSVALEARDLTVHGNRRGRYLLKNVSLEARTGEITAVVGLPDQGQAALAGALAGTVPLTKGRLRLDGRELTGLSPRERGRAGVGFAPGPGLDFGLALPFTVAENMALRRTIAPLRGIRLKGYAEDLLCGADALPEGGVNQPAHALSRAEKQRIVLSREMAREPRALIALDPTRGLNEADARDIWLRLLDFRNSRRAALLITDDLEEALALAGRLLVLCRGEIVGEFDPALTTKRELGLYMTGERRQGREEPFDDD